MSYTACFLDVTDTLPVEWVEEKADYLSDAKFTLINDDEIVRHSTGIMTRGNYSNTISYKVNFHSNVAIEELQHAKVKEIISSAAEKYSYDTKHYVNTKITSKEVTGVVHEVILPGLSGNPVHKILVAFDLLSDKDLKALKNKYPNFEYVHNQYTIEQCLVSYQKMLK